jgi:hypothetical protein
MVALGEQQQADATPNHDAQAQALQRNVRCEGFAFDVYRVRLQVSF